MNTTKYITVKDTNVLIRKVLKEEFPGIKFSVVGDSYAGGASTNVTWTDGPSDKAVTKALGQFVGKNFDPMTDIAGYNYTEIDGVKVHYGTDHVFTNRRVSEAVKAEVEALIASWGFPVEEARNASYPTPQEVLVLRQEVGSYRAYYEMTTTGVLIENVAQLLSERV